MRVLVRKNHKVKKLVYKFLEIGENISWRLNRPAWTSEESSGNMQAFRHMHDRGGIRENFFGKSKK
jgi:hypothetical protein